MTCLQAVRFTQVSSPPGFCWPPVNYTMLAALFGEKVNKETAGQEVEIFPQDPCGSPGVRSRLWTPVLHLLGCYLSHERGRMALAFQDRVRPREGPGASHAMTQGHRRARDNPLVRQSYPRDPRAPCPGAVQAPNRLPPSAPGDLAQRLARLRQRVFICTTGGNQAPSLPWREHGWEQKGLPAKSDYSKWQQDVSPTAGLLDLRGEWELWGRKGRGNSSAGGS